MKHFDEDGWHVYCPANKAGECKKQREVTLAVQKAAKAKAAEEKKAKAAQEVADRAAIDNFRKNLGEMGYVRATGDVFPEATGRAEVFRKKCAFGTVIFCRLEVSGQEIYWESAHGYDDYRHYTWAPAPIVNAWLDQRIAQYGITKGRAAEWLQNFSGCEGEELYRRALETGADEAGEKVE
jgi:hypothetical protein